MELQENNFMASGDSLQKSQFSDLYKLPRKIPTQSDRRDKLLNEVKTRRSDTVDQLRGITDLFVDEPEGEPMDVERHVKRVKTNFGRKIMLSEWLMEVPADLEENWFVKLCPVGVRNIVVAHCATTKVYNRHNQMKGHFVSRLPGGGPGSNGSHFTVLDCIYCNGRRTFYVLDVLVWNSCSLLQCPVDFRFFFLRSKFDENPNLLIKRSNFRFVPVNYMPAQLPLIEQILSEPRHEDDSPLEIDGVLFYHKDGDYKSGLTPLVGWLKPYMIPEMLQVPVHGAFLSKRPKNYTTLLEFFEQVRAMYKKKKKRKEGVEDETSFNEMETDAYDEIPYDMDV